MCPADLCGILRCSVYWHVLGIDRNDLESTDLQPTGHDSSADAAPERAVQPLKPRHLQKYSEAAVLDVANRWQCKSCVETVRGSLGQCLKQPRTGNLSVVESDSWLTYAWWWLSDVMVTSQSSDSDGACEEENAEREFTEELCDAAKMERLRLRCEVSLYITGNQCNPDKIFNRTGEMHKCTYLFNQHGCKNMI